MVPDKFNMVDMDGIDLIMAQGEEIPGLYNRLVESIAQCRYQCLYNWFFDGVVIPPSYVEMEVNEDDEVEINEGVTVSPDDVIHIYSVEPGPVDPEIIPLLAEENGVYNVPAGKDGFNPVTVDVPSYTPVINSLTITENGTYTAPSGVDGYSPITVDVSSGVSFIVDEYSQLLSSVFDTKSSILSGNTIEVAFYANSYVNDGHIVGQSYNSSGNAFHLTTYSNRWYIGGGSEANFAADSDCPLYGADIVFKAKTGEVSMNGVVKTTSFTMPDRSDSSYKLNTRGGAVSTTGVYKYKYVKVYNSNNELICHWQFGHAQIGNVPIYLAHEVISDTYASY